MPETEAERIARRLTPYRRETILRLADVPLTIRGACPRQNCLPSLKSLVQWSGGYLPGGTDATYELTDIGRAVAAALREAKS